MTRAILLLRHAHPPHLHSFPTRRSSDLPSDDFEQIVSQHYEPLYRFAFSLTRTEAEGESVKRFIRSEEHTSELQSHHDLVCRLLLEKKNDRNPLARGTRTPDRHSR